MGTVRSLDQALFQGADHKLWRGIDAMGLALVLNATFPRKVFQIEFLAERVGASWCTHRAASVNLNDGYPTWRIRYIGKVHLSPWIDPMTYTHPAPGDIKNRCRHLHLPVGRERLGRILRGGVVPIGGGTKSGARMTVL